MTIKKRLFWSNILMILVPVIATAIIGVICSIVIWYGFINGWGVGIDDEDFDMTCAAISEMVEHGIREQKGYKQAESFLDRNNMAMSICTEDKNVIYSYGVHDEMDEQMMRAADMFDDSTVIMQDGRGLYYKRADIDGTIYRIYLYGKYFNSTSFSEIKTAVVFSTILIIFTVFMSILLTNRFLTKFVIKRVEEPLDMLADGVHELRDGRLDYRITYNREDEFLPVCEAFNEMAVRLKDMVNTIQQQEKSRRELVAGISHDIRSPLTSIQAYVEGLIDGVARTPERQRQYLNTIRDKAMDLEHIVSQLFLFSKMELDEYPEHKSFFRLDLLILDTVNGIREEYSKDGLDIDTKLEPVYIYADAVYMQRIVTNILSNSLKYKNKDRGHAFITVEKLEKVCRLSFTDDGPGVPEEALSHLFEVFYRSDPARQNPNRGSGLGLAIVANAVKHMDGEIHAKNISTGGLEICINLPIGGLEDGEDIDNRG